MAVEAATFGVVVTATVATVADAVVVPAVDAGSGGVLPIAARAASAIALSVVRPAVTRRDWFAVGAGRAAAVEFAEAGAVAAVRPLVAAVAGALSDCREALLRCALADDVPDFAGPAETEGESWSGLSAEAMPAACGQASEIPTTNVAAPTRAPLWRIDINPTAFPRLVVASAVILECERANRRSQPYSVTR